MPLIIVAASVLASCNPDVNIIPSGMFSLSGIDIPSTVPDPFQENCGQYGYEIIWETDAPDGIGVLYVREKKKIIINGEVESENTSSYSRSSMKQKISGGNYPNTQGRIEITLEARYILKKNAENLYRDVQESDLANATIGRGKLEIQPPIEWDCRCPDQKGTPWI